MKLGMPILYEYETIEENLILAKKLNLDFVELNLNYSYCRKAFEDGSLKELLDKYNLEATLHNLDDADFGTFDEMIKAYFEILEKYLKLGKGFIKNLNTHIQMGPYTTISGIKHPVYKKEYKEYISKLIPNLKYLEKLCNCYGVNLVIENTDHFDPYMLDVYDEMKKNDLHFCLDIGHDRIANCMLSNKVFKEDYHFDEYHFHDATDKKCHLSLGDGDNNLKYFKEKCINDNAYVVLEVKSSDDLIKSVPYFNKI